jgi:amidohydrolase
MIENRRYFHMNPELSFKEVNTPKKISEYLNRLGIEVQTGVGGNGVIGTIIGGKQGKTVALRADFDALPIQDEKEVNYKSTVPGVMHACGHDAHTSTLLAVAKVLSEQRKDLAGSIKLIFQFGEEVSPGGAKAMIEDGCLEGVDAIFGTHFWSKLPVGEIHYRVGGIMAASDRFEIRVIGKGGHGAAPHETVDSIVVGASIVKDIQQIVSRHVNPLTPAVVSVGSFHAGEAFNVISDHATIVGTARTLDVDVQDLIIDRLEKIVKAACDSSGADYVFDYQKGYPAVRNHEEETKLLVDSAKMIVGNDQVKEMDPMMGGEDFSYYLEKVPGTFFFTGAGNDEEGIIHPHHHPKFDIDERAMLNAAKVMATSVVKFLQKTNENRLVSEKEA